MGKTDSLSRLSPATPHTNGILRTTRWLAVMVVPFMIVASAILYLWPKGTGRLFAWPIQPPMTAMMLGPAYAWGKRHLFFLARRCGAPVAHGRGRLCACDGFDKALGHYLEETMSTRLLTRWSSYILAAVVLTLCILIRLDRPMTTVQAARQPAGTIIADPSVDTASPVHRLVYD